MRQFARQLWGWLLGGVAILLAIWFVTNSQSFSDCVKNRYQETSNQTPQQSKPVVTGAVVVTVCVGNFTDKNQGPLTALATIAIAIFTIVLANVSRRQADIARDALNIVERAFVFLEGFDTEITTAAAGIAGLAALPMIYRDHPGLYLQRFAMRPRWKNSGTTPTRGMKIQVNWGTFPPLPMPPTYEYQDQPVPLFLGPQAIDGSRYIEMPTARALIEYGAFRRGQETRILIWGRADYDDVFGKPHFVEWGHELRFDMHDGHTLRASFIQAGDHNRTDEDEESGGCR